MTREEFHVMEKPAGMTFYVRASTANKKRSGRLVKVFKDSVVLDFTEEGNYNRVDHRLFRCEEIFLTPIVKEG